MGGDQVPYHPPPTSVGNTQPDSAPYDESTDQYSTQQSVEQYSTQQSATAEHQDSYEDDDQDPMDMDEPDTGSKTPTQPAPQVHNRASRQLSLDSTTETGPSNKKSKSMYPLSFCELGCSRWCVMEANVMCCVLEIKKKKSKMLTVSVEDSESEMPPPPPTEKKSSERRLSSRRKSGTQQPVQHPVQDQQPTRASSRASFKSDAETVRSTKGNHPQPQMQHPPGTTNKQKQQRQKRHSESKAPAQPQPSPVNTSSASYDASYFKADPDQTDKYYVEEVRPSDEELNVLFEKLRVKLAPDLGGLEVTFALPDDSKEMLRCADVSIPLHFLTHLFRERYEANTNE